jgi:hemerythrin-like domain-containing protein
MLYEELLEKEYATKKEAHTMSRTARFKEQHEEMVKIVVKISGFLDAAKIKGHEEDVVTLLSELSGKLKIHLATEDSTLYPDMLKHKNEKVKTLANKYNSEMSGIKGAFDAYAKKWLSTAAVEKDHAGFIKETKGLFEVLAKRIDKENNELYPAFDAA